MHLLNSFRRDRRGVSGMQILTAVIGIVVAITVVVNLLPEAMIDMSNETIWEGADPAVVSLLTLIVPIVIVASLIMLFMKIRK